MPSLTPLHETYCIWDSTPPSQADLLEGLAQMLTTPLSDAIPDLIQVIQREILNNWFGMSEYRLKKLQKIRYIDKFHRFSYDSLLNSGHYLLAPLLRQAIEKFPKLHNKSLTASQHRIVGILNGILGDYLSRDQNPIALPMVLYDHYGEVQKGDLSGRVVIFVHGLCMNHLYWSNPLHGGIGEKLLAQRDHNTMLYLNYNTGRRISANGHSLANTLQDLLHRNPLITSIDLIGHSMGGLVLRSALFYGKQSLHEWVHLTENLVCLGSPHHGAILERMGFMLQDQLGYLPFVNIIRHLVNSRSNGILDLRYGSVRDDDWEHHPARIGAMDDNRKPAPLPAHINAFFLAGCISDAHKKNRSAKLLGDYLVSIDSALGEHPNPRFQLKLPQSHKAIFYGLNHFQLQSHSSVAEQVAKWFYPPKDQQASEQIQEYTPQWQDLAGIALT